MIWFLSSLAACLTSAEEFQGMLAMVADDDQDGFYARDDCDDLDPDVNPSAAEVDYDGRDNDCDPETLDDDFDRDGYLLVDDCDDSDPATYVGAEERCDNADNDCDGLVDEGVLREFYYDADGDGTGDSARPVEACVEGDTHVAFGGDCDDGDSSVHPNADEVCNDGVDNNCDNQGCTWSEEEAIADGGLRLVGESHAVGFGHELHAADGLVIVGAWHDSVTASRAGAAQVFEGADYALIGSVRGDAANQLMGKGVAYSGRLGRLGEAIVVAAPGYAEGGASGAVFILDTAAEEQRPADARVEILGADSLNGPVALLDGASSHSLVLREGNGDEGRICWFNSLIDASLMMSDADLCVEGEASSTMGNALHAADMDGDGLDELLVSADGVQEVLVLTAETVDVEDAQRIFGQGDAYGRAISAGDVDGDGRPEVAISDWSSQDERGQVWLIGGGFIADQRVDDADAVILGDDVEGRLGWSLSLESDLDGDGRAELVAAAPYASGGGCVYLFDGPIEGGLSPQDALTRVTAESDNDEVGYVLAGGADLDGEGPQDLLIGAPAYGGGGDRPGAAYLWFGRGL